MRGRLDVHTDFLTRERLASYHVDTPDPALECPTVGQRIHIRWALKRADMTLEDLHLLLTIRFYNRGEVTVSIPIERRRGTHLYALFNKDYFDTGGIQTYKLELYSGDCLIETWQHQLWAEKITFSS